MLKKWEGYRLTFSSIENYLRVRYNARSIERNNYHILEKFKYLNQNDFGDPKDCSLTSITASIGYLFKNTKDINIVYLDVENIGYQYFYNGKVGTFPLFIKSIYAKICFQYMIHREKSIQSGYLKNIGFDVKDIKNALLKDYPVILSFNSDKRNYYKNHSVVVTGFVNYSFINEYNTKIEKTFLIIGDNWAKSASLLDIDSLGIMSSIVY